MKFKIFLESQQEYVFEGGNARGTNKKTGVDTLAQKIPIKEIGRSAFIKKFTELFMSINKSFKAKYKRPLWNDTSILKNGTAFNGSTSFIMNPEIHDDEVIPFKPTSGDIDIMIPRQNANDLWYLLDSLEGKEVIKDAIYMGCNKASASSINDQINSVFQVTFGDIVTQSQVDFELSEFTDDKPNEFSRFSHSSALSDAQNGFKGVSHKYLLRALAGGASMRPDIVVITDKSTYEKPRVKMFKGAPLVPNMIKFSVAKGLRYAYEEQKTPSGDDWLIDGKKVYKEIPSKGASYETSILTIFKVLFGDIDSPEIKKMWSFVGIVDLMKKHLPKKSIDKTFDRLLDIQWGRGAQKLERDSADLDLQIKSSAVNYMVKKLGITGYDSKIDKMIKIFYADYHSKKLSESFRETLNEI